MAVINTNPINDRIRKKNDELKTCQDIEDFTKTRAWLEVLEPYLRTNIVGQVGGYDHVRKEWVGGRIQSYKDMDKKEECIYRKQAMMDVYNLIMNYVRSIPAIQAQIAGLNNTKKNLENQPTMGYNKDRYGV